MAKRGRPRKNANYCLCGCGAEVTTKARFVMGHDGKVSHLLAELNHGKIQYDNLPEILKEHLVSCENCKNYMLPTKNQEEPYLCGICRARNKNLIITEMA